MEKKRKSKNRKRKELRRFKLLSEPVFNGHNLAEVISWEFKYINIIRFAKYKVKTQNQNVENEPVEKVQSVATAPWLVNAN